MEVVEPQVRTAADNDVIADASSYPTDLDGNTKTDFSLVLSDSALMRIKFLQHKDSEKFSVLKILVEGGGCSGFSYNFDVISEAQLNEAKSEMEDMLIFERDGVRVISDEMTLEMINGSKIDYVQEMIRSAFEVTVNPMADNGCSCGVSFSPKNL